MAKSTNSEIVIRIGEVAELLIKGKTSGQIVDYCAENFQVAERQSFEYIRRAETLIKETVDKDVALVHSKAAKRFERVWRDSLERGDLRTALNANKELAALHGLYKQQVEHSGQVIFVSNIPE